MVTLDSYIHYLQCTDMVHSDELHPPSYNEEQMHLGYLLHTYCMAYESISTGITLCL